MPLVPITAVQLFDDADGPWIAQLLDVVERSLGQPWRVLLERIDHAPLAIGRREVPPRARQAVVNALRRMLGGRSERTRIARKVRALVLGHPALDRAARDARIGAAAGELGIEPADVESLLWADLARERPVVLPGGRPDPRRLAAFANLDRLQREMRRAREIELHLRSDNAHQLVRMAARCGLIASASRAPDGSLLLRVTGPLALFHATTVYGRALAALVPLLVEHDRFVLDIHCDFASGPRSLRVESPVLLPPLPAFPKPSLADRLARELGAAFVIEREPAPLVVDDHILFPDLAIDHGPTRVLVEIVGFSTAEYLADKLALYRALDQPVILCVDTKRSRLDDAHPSVLPFQRRVDAEALIERLGELR